jgi:peptidoglycan/LPS O-acetylase OafA/YrhL
VALLMFLVFLHEEQILTHQGLASFLFLSSVKPHAIGLIFQRLCSHHSFDLVTHHILNGDYFDQFNVGFGVFWSLSVEEIFYLLWAPIILMGSRRVVLSCLIGPILMCPILRGLAHTSTNFSDGFGFLFRFDSIAAGACIALLFSVTEGEQLDRRSRGRWLAVAGVTSFLALGALSSRCGLFRGMELRSDFFFSVFGYSLLGVLCASVVGLCVSWTDHASIPLRFLRSSTPVYLETISYVMYLIHLPVNVAVHLAFLRLGGRIASLNTLHAAVGILCTVVLAGLSWKFLETPILKLKDRQFGANLVSK